MRSVVVLLLVALLASPARAETTVDVELGWNGLVRPGAWAPALATVATTDRDARAAVLEWYAPQPGAVAMVLRQPIVLNRGEQTFAALLPIGPDAWATHLRVADAITNRTLAVWPREPTTPDLFAASLVLGEGEARLAAVAGGPAAALDGLAGVSVARVGELQLPRAAIGYGALDALVLADAELAELPYDVQAAIAAWVRGGGTLWLWPSGSPLPTTSPLVDTLAETIGRPTRRPDAAGWLVGGQERAFASLGDGQIAFFGRPPTTAELPALNRATPPAGETLTVTRPGGGWLWPWLLVSLVIGPADLIALWLSNDRRRWPRRAATVGLASLAACTTVAAWRGDVGGAATPEAAWWRAIGDGRGGAIVDVPVVLTEDGLDAAWR